MFASTLSLAVSPWACAEGARTRFSIALYLTTASSTGRGAEVPDKGLPPGVSLAGTRRPNLHAELSRRVAEGRKVSGIDARCLVAGCGPLAMVEEAERAAAALSVDFDQEVFEF